jgi:hypothetical protein
MGNIKVQTPVPKKLMRMTVGTGDATNGQLMSYSSNTCIPSVAACASAILLGVALEAGTVALSSVITLHPIFADTILEIPIYQTGAIITALRTMIGTAYDYVISSTNCYVDLNDTTGASMMLVGMSDDGKVGYFRVISTCRFLA